MKICELCRNEAELQESHIIPGFVFKWLKKSSVTGYFRSGEVPNRRAQDGDKLYLLCKNCEQKLNEWETIFANKIFHPFHNGQPVEAYGDWLLRFSVSISWRLLLFSKKHSDLSHCNYSQLQATEKALNTWRNYLLNSNSHLGVFEQHILPLSEITVATDLRNIPPNINRYIMRSIDTDVFCSETEAYTFAKLGRIFIFGFVEISHPEHWRDTKINTDKGDFIKKYYKLPETIKNSICYKAKKASEVHGKLSAKQLARIEMDYRENASKY